MFCAIIFRFLHISDDCIIEVQKQLDSFRSILDHIEEYQAIPYKKRIDELEKELSILRDTL